MLHNPGNYIDIVVNIVGRLPKDSRKLGTHDKYEDGHYYNWCISYNKALFNISQGCHWARKCLCSFKTKEGCIGQRWWWTTIMIVGIGWELFNICIHYDWALFNICIIWLTMYMTMVNICVYFVFDYYVRSKTNTVFITQIW